MSCRTAITDLIMTFLARYHDSLLFNLVLSALIVFAAGILVKLLNRFFVSRQLSDKKNRTSYRAWTVATRNMVAALVFLLLLGIWVSELKSVAISLAAFAAALMISGKELVMCFLGAFMRMLARPFQLGDLVEIGPYAGEVVDMDVLTTTLVEVASTRQFTGYTVQVPNALLLTHAVRNHSTSGKYTLDMVRIPLPEHADPDEIEARLLSAAHDACAPFLEAAGHSLRRYGDTRFLDLSQFEPRVMFEPAQANRMDAIVRFPAPVGGRLPVAQEIIRRFYRETRISPALASAGPGEPVATAATAGSSGSTGPGASAAPAPTAGSAAAAQRTEGG